MLVTPLLMSPVMSLIRSCAHRTGAHARPKPTSLLVVIYIRKKTEEGGAGGGWDGNILMSASLLQAREIYILDH